MTCEEFERIGWNAERDATLNAEERAAAFAHAAHCPVCAAMEDSWLAAKMELRGLATATEAAETPSRVEMRLRQEFRTRHRSLRVRRGAMVLSWGLAAAAIIFSAITWVNWRNGQHDLQAAISKDSQTAPTKTGGGAAQAPGLSGDPGELSEALIADSGGDFTPLPGSMFMDSDSASIVRVRMQRGSLSALGLPVNEERAGEWIQVDLLVTDDGLPQGVRLSP
jgi:hypothetical protein